MRILIVSSSFKLIVANSKFYCNSVVALVIPIETQGWQAATFGDLCQGYLVFGMIVDGYTTLDDTVHSLYVTDSLSLANEHE